MHRRLAVAVACVLAACLRGSSAAADAPRCSVDAAARGRFADAARAAGATVRVGGFSLWRADESCVTARDCGNAKCVPASSARARRAAQTRSLTFPPSLPRACAAPPRRMLQ
jgi:hypothetical protein